MVRLFPTVSFASATIVFPHIPLTLSGTKTLKVKTILECPFIFEMLNDGSVVFSPGHVKFRGVLFSVTLHELLM